jgi:mRNA interferase MazF
VGREQTGTRPALVISVDRFNHGLAGLVVVLPITSKDKRQPIHVRLKPPEGDLTTLSFIKCDDIRSVSKQRVRRFYGPWPHKRGSRSRSKSASESSSIYEPEMVLPR